LPQRRGIGIDEKRLPLMLTSPNLKIEDKALINTELLTSLEHVRWNIVYQAYGSSHSTLVGKAIKTAQIASQ
jgi:hypothetical protein